MFQPSFHASVLDRSEALPVDSGDPALRRVNASQHFRSFWAAWRTIAGYEAIHMIRKGQACGSALAGRAVLLHRFILGLFSAVAV